MYFTYIVIFIYICLYTYVIYIYSREYSSVTNTVLLASSEVTSLSFLSHRARILFNCGQRCTGLWKWTQPGMGL